MMRHHDEPAIPDGKDFIFSIFDDTDVSTLEGIRPVYDCLYELGLLTTKSVWPLADTSSSSDYIGSDSLENADYAAYIRGLAERGFEIAFHGAGMESSRRERTVAALDYFNRVLGFYPRTYAGHAGNSENLYWGEHRFTFSGFRWLYRLLGTGDARDYSGHLKWSPYYWGDVCRRHVDYVRTFTFDELNLLRLGRFPYSVAGRDCLNACFYTHFADHVEEFNRLLTPLNQDRLERQRGVLIVTTHFGKGFVKDGILNSRTRQLLEELAGRNGYFVPVCSVLDHLRRAFGPVTLRRRELLLLEWRWFVHAVRQRLRRLDYEKTELPYLRLK